MKYDIYRTQTRQLIRMAQLSGKKISKTDLRGNMRQMDEMQMACHCMIDPMQESMIQTTLGRVLLQEGLWLEQDQRRTFFLDNQGLVSNLLLARFSHENLTCPDKPIRFALALPSGSKHQGHLLQPALITIGRAIDIVTEHKDSFNKRFKLNVDTGIDNADQLAILLSTRALDAPESVPGFQGTDYPYLSLLVGGPQLTAILDADLDQDAFNFIPLVDEPLAGYLTQKEKLLQVLLTRLAMSFWIYWQTKPDAITTGIPGHVQDGDAPMMGKAVSLRASNPKAAPVNSM